MIRASCGRFQARQKRQKALVPLQFATQTASNIGKKTAAGQAKATKAKAATGKAKARKNKVKKVAQKTRATSEGPLSFFL